MTREQFLNDLKAALSGMAPEEMEGVIAYYSEMIDDRIEAGMSEEAAVKAMEPVKEIAGRVLEEAGVAGQKEEPRDKSNWQEICRPAETVRELHIQAENKRVRVTGDEETEQVTLRYCIGPNDVFQLHEDDGVLTLEHKVRPMSSFVNEKSGEGITLESVLSGVGKLLSSIGDRLVGAGGIFSGDSAENEIEVVVPKAFSGRLHVGTSNARVSADDITCAQPITLTTSNSRIIAENVTCARELTLTTSNSRITLNDVNAASARLSTSNGKVELDDVYIRGELIAHNSNGSITAGDTVAEGALRLTTSNGSIALDDTASPDITLKTSNGTIGGIVKGLREEYTIRSSTSNASNQLGNFDGGEKKLSAVTSNAPITLKFGEQ